MASLRERVRVVRWFLQRPQLYPELVRFARRRLQELGHDRKREARDATLLCEQTHVDANAAIAGITGRAPQSFDTLFAAELEEARTVLRAAPVAMHGAGNLDLIYNLCEHLQATRAIETGVSAGWSSLAFLLSLAKRNGRLVSTDMPYPGSSAEAQQCVGIVVPAPLRASWELIAQPDHEALPQALTSLPILDIAHYDSDKSYAGRLWAYRRLWAALRDGGILISDDIDDNFGFFHFCGEVNAHPIVVKMAATKGAKYIGIITKNVSAHSQQAR